MNRKKGSTSPADSASTPFYREDQHPQDAARVRAVETGQLRILYDAATAMRDALSGIISRPAFSGAGALFDWMSEEDERLNDIRAYAIEEMERRPMDGSIEDDFRIGCVAAWEIRECGEDLLVAIGKLVTMQSAHEDAKRAARSAGEKA